MSEGDRFNPYTDNGGTTLAIKGTDFVVIASDTRASEGYSILSRDAPKTFKVTDKIVIAMAGMRADAEHLYEKLEAQVKNFHYQTGNEIDVSEYAMLLSRNLYFRRFFPWYTFNIVAGIDHNGKPECYSYDAVGCLGASHYACAGSGESMAITVLDEKLMPIITQKDFGQITKEFAVELMKSTFVSVAEREIYTGDKVVYHIIDQHGVQDGEFQLRKD